jgi:hypothetical protein
MFVEEPVFWKYRTFNKDGFWDGGIEENAPVDAKNALKEFLKEEQKVKEEGIET